MKFLIFLIITTIPLVSYADAPAPIDKMSGDKKQSIRQELSQSNNRWEVESLYNQGQYQMVLENIDMILRTMKNIPDSLLMRLYTYQAYSYVALDRKEQALSSFRYLLILNPKLQLDPRFVSPKIIEVLEESRRMRGDSLRLTPPFVPIEQITPTTFKNRAMRSLIYPGMGQLYQQKKTKGYLFLGLETASIIGLVTSHFSVNSAHHKYLDARDQNDIDQRYQDYKFWYQVRFGFAISAVSVWFLNYIDATILN